MSLSNKKLKASYAYLLALAPLTEDVSIKGRRLGAGHSASIERLLHANGILLWIEEHGTRFDTDPNVLKIKGWFK